jgi:predicted ATPase
MDIDWKRPCRIYHRSFQTAHQQPTLITVIITDDTRSNAVLAKFMVACKTFLQAMSSKEHPIVLFIDDIQWMDEGSKPLIQLLLRAQGLPNVMMIFAYRDEDQETVSDILNDIRDEQEHTTLQLLDIALHNLEVQSVHELVAAKIGNASAGTEELGNLIVTKTRGNPFHVVQFIQVLQREELLMYNPDTTLWEFDVDRIQREMMVSDTVAELLAVKTRRLPRHAQDCLKIASFLGYRFREDLLSLSYEFAGQSHRQEWQWSRHYTFTRTISVFVVASSAKGGIYREDQSWISVQP